MLGRKLVIRDGSGERKNYAEEKGLEEKQRSNFKFFSLSQFINSKRCLDKPVRIGVVTYGGIV